MSAALAIVAVLFGLLVLLFAVPLELAFRLERVEVFNGQITIRWLFGLLRFRIPIPGAETTPRIEAAKPKKPARRGARPHAIAVFRQAAFRRRVWRLVTDLLGAAHLRELHLRLRLGLGDPADTGWLWALVGPLSVAAQSLRNAEVRIEPEFMDEAFELHADGRLLLVPLQFLVLAVGFALSPASLRAWWSLRAGHA